jgi:hypothetical protein
VVFNFIFFGSSADMGDHGLPRRHSGVGADLNRVAFAYPFSEMRGVRCRQVRY